MCHVLIIEDEPLIALDLESLLEIAGATSFAFAASQSEAVTVASERRPDIITSDVTLLEGTGPAAIAIIRAAQGCIPVIYISAIAPLCRDDDPMTRALSKPLNRSALGTVFTAMRPSDSL